MKTEVLKVGGETGPTGRARDCGTAKTPEEKGSGELSSSTFRLFGQLEFHRVNIH